MAIVCCIFQFSHILQWYRKYKKNSSSSSYGKESAYRILCPHGETMYLHERKKNPEPKQNMAIQHNISDKNYTDKSANATNSILHT